MAGMGVEKIADALELGECQVEVIEGDVHVNGRIK
jgi:hypothetical protein